MSHTNTKPEQNAAQHVQTGLPAVPDTQPQGFIDRYAKIWSWSRCCAGRPPATSAR